MGCGGCKVFDHLKRMALQYLMNRWFLPLRPIPNEPDFPFTDDLDAKALLARMTLEEKIGLISGTHGFSVKAVARLGLPPLWMADATSGVRGVDAPVTAFPAPIAMAASWDVPMVRLAGKMIASECRASGVSILLAPGVNIARVPVCGRNFEYMGEDPLLAGEIASAYVEGVQSQGVGVTVKHFACNNSEYDRHKSNSIVDEQTLRELYLKAFEIVVHRGATGVMTSYNQVNGTYASEHPLLIGQILRSEWKFDGLVVSDWNSLYSTEGAFRSGVDLEMPSARWFTQSKIKGLIGRDGTLAKVLDTKVLRLLSTAQRLGAFRRPVTDRASPSRTARHRNHARSLAADSVVLLKNNGLLPLDPVRCGRVVVLGNAVAGEPVGGGGSSFIKQAEPSRPIALALQESLANAQVLPFAGTWWKSKSRRAVVATADVVVVSTGFNHVYESESYDRMWQLDRSEMRTIKEACGLSDRVVVVLHGGGALEMASWIDAPRAVLMAWYLGEESANALCDLMLGRVNPSGKLPVTIAKRLSDHESMRAYPGDFARFSLKRIAFGQGNPGKRSVMDIHYREGLMVGYRQFDTVGPDPLFPFGFGLSYTTFAFRDMRVEEEDDGWKISFVVSNTGTRAGAEVAQLYVRPPDPGRSRPMQQLRGFAKVFLQPGEECSVSLMLTRADLSSFRAEIGTWIVPEGLWGLAVGSSSRHILLEGHLVIQESPGQEIP